MKPLMIFMGRHRRRANTALQETRRLGEALNPQGFLLTRETRNAGDAKKKAFLFLEKSFNAELI